jgi:hypothetical protein
MPRQLRWRLAGSTLALVAGFACPASAQPQVEPIRLTYRATSDCPAEARFVDAVRRRTARWQVVAGEVQARAFDVDVSAGGNRSGGVLRITALDGSVAQRAVAGATCAEVVSALALMTALAIDPSGTAGESAGAKTSADPSAASPPEGPDAGGSSGPPVAPPDPPGAATLAPSPSAESPVAARGPSASSAARWGMGVDGQATGALLAQWGFGGGAFVEVEAGDVGPFVPSARASVFATMTSAAFGTGIGAELVWLFGRMEVCPWRVPRGGPLTLGVCASLDAGVLHSKGAGLPTVGTEAHLWLAPGALARAQWSIARDFWIEASGGVTVPLERYGLYYQRTGGLTDAQASQIAAVGAVITLGTGVRFP